MGHETVIPRTSTTTPSTQRHVLREGDEVPVASPRCPATATLPQNPCCMGQACCEAGKAKVVAGRNVSWKHDTDLVIVTSQVTPDNLTRPDARKTDLSWITDQKLFPYVLCPFCTVELNPLCAVRTNQGFESAVYLAFIVYNYHRLPRTVAFVHGHSWLQFGKRKQKCTNFERLQQLRPFLSEDIFIYLQARNSEFLGSRKVDRYWRDKWEMASGQPLPADLMNFSFAIGPHIVVGRKRILERPREFYERLFRFASGRGQYENETLANSQAFFGAGAWTVELWGT